MFFRRKLLDSGCFFFDESYRCGGDGEWMVRLLQAGVRMARLGEFSSVFAFTGANLSQGGRAREEWRRLRDSAPGWVRALSPAWIALHRLRRLAAGSYIQRPFSFSLYTPDSPAARVMRHARRPNFRCPS
jgi:hypothetical protein